MKRIITTLFLAFLVLSVFGQKKTAKLSDIIRPGLSISAFYNPKGEYVYLLNQNASLKETVENQFGATVSLVWLIPVNEEGTFNVLLNVPIFDLKNDISNIKVSNGLFNTQTPFGLGVAFFPFPKFQTMGFSVTANYLSQNKMRDEPLRDNFFPIADYRTFDLKVNAPVPEAVLKPFVKREAFVTANIGVVFRL